MSIWVVEEKDSFGWYPVGFYNTRSLARDYKREYGIYGETRIRKYKRVEESH